MQSISEYRDLIIGCCSIDTSESRDGAAASASAGLQSKEASCSEEGMGIHVDKPMTLGYRGHQQENQETLWVCVYAKVVL